jgi:hypothetical protein
MTDKLIENEGNTSKRSRWLNQLSAHMVDGYENTEYGKSKVKIVSFKDEKSPMLLLEHVWYGDDIYANSLLPWLRELGDHQNIEVRLRVAATVGHLSAHEFRPVYDQVILPWAKSPKNAVRKLASLALTVLACDEDEDIAQQSLNVLHRWSNLENATALHWTAITAYGGYLGQIYPQQALDNLKTMIQAGNGLLFPAIAQALSHLFESGQQVQGLDSFVLKSIKNWVETGVKTSIHQLSMIIFWELMRKSHIYEGGCIKPTLLVMSKQTQDNEDCVVNILGQALNLELTRELVLTEFFNWLQLVDKCQELFKTSARIVVALYSKGNYREQQRIYTYICRWSKSANNDSINRILILIEKRFNV